MISSLPLRIAKPSCLRSFSTSIPRALPKPEYEILQTPPYPYGASNWYKQSNHGLYGGLRIRAGNNVSEKSKTKTRRVWRPNVGKHQLRSKALDRNIRMKVAVRVLRTIKKVGGLDEYVLGEKAARIKELGPMGWKLRWAVMQVKSVRMRMGQEAKRLGVSAEKRFERGWMTRAEMVEFLTDSKSLTATMANQRATDIEDSNEKAATEANNAVIEEEENNNDELSADVEPAGIEDDDQIANPASRQTAVVTDDDISHFSVIAAASDAAMARKAIAHAHQASKSAKTMAAKGLMSPEKSMAMSIIDTIWNEQQNRARPMVKTLHRLGGKRGQRLQKHAILVRRKKQSHHEPTRGNGINTMEKSKAVPDDLGW